MPHTDTSHFARLKSNLLLLALLVALGLISTVLISRYGAIIASILNRMVS